MIDLNTVKKIHFVGIGGIGVSAIARMMHLEGKTVSGSDVSGGMVVTELKKLGIKIKIGHNAKNVSRDVDLVVYTIAVRPSNPELSTAKKAKIPMITYPEMLGQVSASKFTVAIAGTHGKTTTTAMLATIAVRHKLDPTVVVGSYLKDHQTNFIAGKSNLFIVEACEYRRSFLNISPKILVITNIDIDHLDYYRDLRDIQRAFKEMVARLPTDGLLVCDPNDSRVRAVAKSAKCRVIDYTKVSSRIVLKVPGKHNVWNAQAAIAAAQTLGVPQKASLKALAGFKGTWRRFEYKGKAQTKAAVYIDYGHNPTEVRVTIDAAKSVLSGQKKRGRLIVVFQPHLYSRTKMLLKEFSTSFGLADQVLVVDIYAAREKVDRSIHSRDIVAALKRKGKVAYYAPSFAWAKSWLERETGPSDMILLQGAGNIDQLGAELV